jgi:maleate isomerase
VNATGETPDYGARGRFGLLVPQSNPTVEPEFRRLLPPHAECYVARLTSRAPDARARLVEYVERLEETLAQFDTLRLAAIAFACTGSSYLVGADRERELLDAAATACGAPVESAAGAIAAALRHLGARRVCVVSPYPAWLRDAGVAYWRAAGFEVTCAVDVPTGRADTRGIYELRSADARAVLASLDPRGADVVLLSGTGMPTLPLLRTAHAHLPPLLASNACLAWRLRARCAADPRASDVPGASPTGAPTSGSRAHSDGGPQDSPLALPFA